MTEINQFDFKKYDIGGSDSTAGDGRLTGAEVDKAEADGWTVWDGCKEGDNITQIDKKSQAKPVFQTILNMLKSDSYKEFSKLKNEILEKKLAAKGIYPTKIDGKTTYNIDDILFNPVFKNAEKEAENEAKKQLGLSEDGFTNNAMRKLSECIKKTFNKTSPKT